MTKRLRLTFAAIVLAAFNLWADTLYVSLESTNPVAPYSTWATAATNIQHAVDAAQAGDTVLVTNGVYAVGKRNVSVLDMNQQPPRLLSPGPSRVVVTNAIRLESVNGPELTIIKGLHITNGCALDSIRCVLLQAQSVLNGFTLAHGGTADVADGIDKANGGGAWCASTEVTLTNCVVTNNFAGSHGGGVYGGTLHDCTLANNKAVLGHGAAFGRLYNSLVVSNIDGYMDSAGGGGYRCVFSDCVLRGNVAYKGGAVCKSTLYDCLIVDNGAGWCGSVAESTLYRCTLTANWDLFGTFYDCLIYGNRGGIDGSLFGCTVVANDQGLLDGTAFNSIIYYNFGGNYTSSVSALSLNYCCTMPLPVTGVGNMSSQPLFMDLARGDFRLQEDSPCIDAGTNLVGSTVPIWRRWSWDIVMTPYANDPTDILGNTRFIDGNGDGKVAWDMGAYEFNSFKPPRFTSAPQLTADAVKLTVTGEPNKWARVLRSGNLKDWEDIWSGSLGSEGKKEVTDADMGQRMSYRAVVP